MTVLTLYSRYHYFEPFINLPPRSIKDYYRVIAEPISLRKLQKMVNGTQSRGDNGVSEFKSWSALEEKASLLWRNAYYYNEEGSDIYELARELEVSAKIKKVPVANMLMLTHLKGILQRGVREGQGCCRRTTPVEDQAQGPHRRIHTRRPVQKDHDPRRRARRLDRFTNTVTVCCSVPEKRFPGAVRSSQCRQSGHAGRLRCLA